MANVNVLALDVGGTNTRVVIYGPGNEVVARGDFATKPNDFEEWLTILGDSFGAGFGFGHDLSSIGLSVAGNVEKGVLTGSGNLPGWKDVDLVARLGGVFHKPVVVLNDCAAAALGEYPKIGRSFTYIIWGTGVGVSFVNAEKGAPAAAATELGHMIIDYLSPFRCGCGGRGHLEAFVGGGNLKDRFNDDRVENWTPELMSEEQWESTLSVMAAGLNTIRVGRIGQPIVIGGGVAIKQLEKRKRLARLQTLLAELVAPTAVPSLSIAKCGDEGGLLGAATAARQMLV